MLSKVFAVVALFLALPLSVSAQAVSQNQEQAAPATIIADINISDSRLLSSGADGLLRVGFTVVNNSQAAQSDIRFGIDIVKKTGQGQTVVDTFVVEQTLALAPRESSRQELAYPVPAFLSGEYEVWVIAKTTAGLMLGLGRAGTTTFSASSAFVEIVPESCVLQVTGEEKAYTLYQGVDVAKNETLSFSCTVENHASSPISVSPFFDTYRRSMYGEKMDIPYPVAQAISLAANEQKTVAFAIPLAALPQAYDVSIMLRNTASQSPVSNKVIAHYVLRGTSATIQNATLDQSSYAAGETLNARLFWTPSADQFPGSRAGQDTKIPAVIVKLAVLDGNGQACIDPISKKVAGTEINLTLQATVLAACAAPEATYSLSDEAGNILDTRTFSSPQEKKQAAMATAVPVAADNSSSWDAKTLLIGIIALLTLIGLFAVIRKMSGVRRNFPPSNGLKSLLFFVLMAGGMALGAGEAKGATFTLDWTLFAYGYYMPTYEGDPDGWPYAPPEKPEWVKWGTEDITQPVYYVTVNIDKSTYVPGELISVTGDMFSLFCVNSPTSGSLTATLPGVSTQTLLSGTFVGDVLLYGSASFTAPSVPGSYVISFTGWASEANNGPKTINIPFTVTAPAPVNGACGFSDGAVLSSAPVSGLCSAGTPSGVSGSGPWTWTCAGQSGGTTTSCSAALAPSAPTVDFKINGSDGPLSLASGDMKNITWTTNALSCTASSSDGFGGVKPPSGSQSLTANLTSDHTLTCTNASGLSTSDSVQVNVSCTPSTGAYGACQCPQETKSRTNVSAACVSYTETVDCTSTEKNSCRDFNWKEVAP